MTQRRKARVGDTIRLNGKNPARQSGEHVVNRVVEARHTHPDGSMSTYWVGWKDDSDDPHGSAWELQFDIVEPEPEFNKGDRVKLTPKDGGETVIYGEISDFTPGKLGTGDRYITITESGTDTYIDAWFNLADWNIELVKPTTEEILNGLGQNAFVAHRTDADYYGYYKRDGKWYDADEERASSVKLATVAMFIDTEGFEIIFEGVKDE